MSNFLAHLVQRATGLAPVVRARAAPDAAVTDDGVVGPDATAPIAAATPPMAASIAPTAAAIAAPPAPFAPSLMPTLPARALGSAPPAGAQRRMATPSLPVATPVLAHPVMPAPRDVASPLPHARTPAAAMHDAAPPARPRAEGVATPTPAPAIVPAIVLQARSDTPPVAPRAMHDGPPIEHTERGAATSGGHVIDPVHETIRVTERVLEPAPARAAAAPLDFGPAPATPAPAALPPALADRIVHVRIGAIEIHGAVATPAAPTPAPAAPAPGAPPAVAGFDAYARLRSYAPWEW